MQGARAHQKGRAIARVEGGAVGGRDGPSRADDKKRGKGQPSARQEVVESAESAAVVVILQPDFSIGGWSTARGYFESRREGTERG